MNLFSEIEWCLKNLSYPMSENSTLVSTKSFSSSKHEDSTQSLGINKEKFEETFKIFAEYMLEIESPSNRQRSTSNETTGTSFNKDESLVSKFHENTLIQLLIRPLEKKFKFHFCTARKTNNLDKVK